MRKTALVLTASQTSVRWIAGLCVALALLISARSARAAPIVVDVSGATCYACWGDPTLPSIDFTAQLTLDSVAGTFWDPVYTTYVSHQELMLTGITGTVSIGGAGSYSFGFLPPNPAGDGWSAPLGTGSWLFDINMPRYLVFSALGSGFDTRIINDNAYDLFQWSSPATGFGTQVPISWTAVLVPEPSSVSLLAVGLVAVALLKSKKPRAIC